MITDWILLVKPIWWLLIALVIILPIRWSLLAFIVLAHFDLSGPQFASASGVGLENAIKIVALPIILIGRLKIRPVFRPWPTLLKLWALLVIYAGLSIFWSPFWLSGIKMLGYLTSHVLVFLLFAYAWQHRMITVQTIKYAVWLSLLVAIGQSIVLDNPFGTAQAGVQLTRFTSFSSPQSFAAFLVTSVALIIFSNRIGRFGWLTVAAAGAGLLLSGSRYAYLGLALLALTWFVIWLQHSQTQMRFKRRMLLVFLLMPVSFGTLFVLPNIMPNNRISELYLILEDGQQGFTQLGAFRWRLGMYDAALERMSTQGTANLLFGRGMSSGAEVALSYDSRYSEFTIDANRVLHSEPLRVLYEWGLIGLCLFLVFLIGIMLYIFHLSSYRSLSLAAPALGVLPLFIMGLAIENILAGAGTPSGIGFVLVFSYLMKQQQ